MQREQVKSLIIYGCGGHARSVADVALFNGYEQLTFVDKNARDNETQFGFSVIKAIPEPRQQDVIVAIGENNERAEMFVALSKQQSNIVVLIANDAYVGADVVLEPGVFVGHAAHIGPNVKIGVGTLINTRSIIEHDCEIGAYCHISVNAVIAGKSKIGNNVMVGTGAVVIDGLTVCANVTIGAGAVVVADIKEPGTYVGVPAKKIK